MREVDRFIGVCTGNDVDVDQASLEQLERCVLEPDELRELLLAGRAVVYDVETWEPPELSHRSLFVEHHAVIAASVAYRLSSGEWAVEQWFADRPEEEYQVLSGALEFLTSVDAILTYNGDSFDVPCTLQRLEHWGLDYHFPLARHYDLIVHAFALKEQGAIPNARLQTLEVAHGINRVDTLSGAEVPGLYVTYLETRDPSIPALILQHNREDVLYLARDIAPDLLASPPNNP